MSYEEVLKRVFVEKGKLWFINGEIKRLSEIKEKTWKRILKLEKELNGIESD